MEQSHVVDLIGVLHSDVERAVREARDRQQPYDRRMCLRSIGAAIDGSVFMLRRALLELATLSPGERLVVEDRRFRVNDSGRVEWTNARTPVMNGLHALLDLAAKTIAPSWTPDLGDASGWKPLSTCMDIRDRVTHPRSRAEVELTADEIETCIHGWDWLEDTIRRIIIEGYVARQTEHEFLSVAAEVVAEQGDGPVYVPPAPSDKWKGILRPSDALEREELEKRAAKAVKRVGPPTDPRTPPAPDSQDQPRQ